MKKTSAVPLRKETVRVTLKADPKDSAAPKPPSPPKAPSTPKPPAPAPTIPLKTSGPGTAKPPTPAPTVKLQTGDAPTAPKPGGPAPTVKLNTPTTTGPATANLTGGSSQPLPKATVQLQQTQPMGAAATPSQAATIRTADEDDSDDRGEGASTALSVVALVAALVVLGVQLATASIWVDGEWGKLFE